MAFNTVFGRGCHCSVVVVATFGVLVSLAPTRAQSLQGADEQTYTNARYHYRLTYKGTLSGDHTDPLVDILTIAIDPKAEPIHVCAAENLRKWTSEQLFHEWKLKPPISRSGEFPCADYPSYARLAGSVIMVDGHAAYQVVSFRGPFETVCSYLATTKTLLGVCLPPENPAKAPAWQGHLSVYKRILESLKVSE